MLQGLNLLRIDYADLYLRVFADYSASKEEVRGIILSHPYLYPSDIQFSKEGGSAVVSFICLESDWLVHRAFGLIHPEEQAHLEKMKMIRNKYVKNVGELRAAIAELPDEFPLIHTGYDQHGVNANRQGALVMVNEWAWVAPGGNEYGPAKMCLRVSGLSGFHWREMLKKEELALPPKIEGTTAI